MTRAGADGGGEESGAPAVATATDGVEVGRGCRGVLWHAAPVTLMSTMAESAKHDRTLCFLANTGTATPSRMGTPAAGFRVLLRSSIAQEATRRQTASARAYNASLAPSATMQALTTAQTKVATLAPRALST